jgi:hypothetical protein
VRNSVKKWCGFGVVLMKSGEKKWKSEKKLQKVEENNQHFIKPPRAPRKHEENQLTVISEQLSVEGEDFLPRINAD